MLVFEKMTVSGELCCVALPFCCIVVVVVVVVVALSLSASLGVIVHVTYVVTSFCHIVKPLWQNDSLSFLFPSLSSTRTV